MEFPPFDTETRFRETKDPNILKQCSSPNLMLIQLKGQGTGDRTGNGQMNLMRHVFWPDGSQISDGHEEMKCNQVQLAVAFQQGALGPLDSAPHSGAALVCTVTECANICFKRG